MSIEKSQIKSQVAYDLGCKLDDLLEKAATQEHYHQGKKDAFKSCREQANTLLSLVDRDLDEGKYKGLSDLEVSSLLKKQVVSLLSKITELGRKAEVDNMKSMGEQEAYRKAVDIVKKTYDREQRSIVQLTESAKKTAERMAAKARAEEAEEAEKSEGKPKEKKPKARARKATKTTKTKGSKTSGTKKATKAPKTKKDTETSNETVLFVNTKNDSITEIPDPAPRVPGSHPGKGLAATRKRRVSKRAGPK